jgi:hypothetical protein
MANKFKKYNISQRFFVEKMLDLYYEYVIDSYRVRVHNPISLLEECNNLIEDWNFDKIKRFDTLKQVFQELILLLKNDLDDTVDYGFTGKSIFIDKLETLSKCDEKNIDTNGLYELKYHIIYLLRINKDYINNLILKIENLLTFTKTDIASCIPHFDKLSTNIGFFATELTRIGYSKVRVYQIFSRTFIASQKDRTFDENWSYIKDELLKNRERTFCVAFKFNISSNSEYSTLLSDSVDEAILPNPIESSRIDSYIKEDVSVRFKTFQIEALDFYQAIQKARESLSSFLDILHIAFENVQISIHQDVLVVDQDKKEKARIQKINFLIDGGYIEKEYKYDSLNSSVITILENTYIANEVKAKINSAIRYLRMGNESYELEQKYISYWIAIEHIFSINQKDSSTITRMLEHLTKIQVVYYLKRNIQYIHTDIKKKLSKTILNREFPFVQDDLSYFTDDALLGKLSANIKFTPLLSYKINKIKSALHASDKIKEYLKRHESNVKMHISRLYRIRNEIMHEAAIIPNIENITGNLKYYLVFTLNLLLEYFSDADLDIRASGEITLNDFFNHQTLLYKALEAAKFDKSKLVEITLSRNILI